MDELRELRQTIRSFVERELLPLEQRFAVGEIDQASLTAVQKTARASGLWLLDVPEEHGGAGLNAAQMCVVWEELYRAWVLPARIITVFGPQPGPMLFQCRGDQVGRYLVPVLEGTATTAFAQTEPGAGSDVAAITTSAVRDHDGWVINGAKQFITGAGDADFLQVVCVTGRSADGRRPELSVFLVDTSLSGVSIDGSDITFDGEATWRIALNNVRVDDGCLLGGVGEGFALAQGWLIRGRLHQAARSIALADRSLAMATDYARIRRAADKAIIDHQAIGFMLANSFIELQAVRAYLHRCAQLHDDGADIRYDAAAIKIMGVETAGRVVDRAVQVHGGAGLMKDLPFGKWAWDLRSLRLTEGSTEVLRDFIARGIKSSRAATTHDLL